METKKCPKCQTTKTSDEFFRCASKPGGMQTYCKSCFVQYRKDLGAPAREARGEAKRLRWSAVTEKTCGKCKATKPLSDFFKNSARAHLDGVQADCKACQIIGNKSYQRTPTGRVKQRAVQLKMKYHLTSDAISVMLAAQDNRCACCNDTLSPGRGTHIDHDHSCCPTYKTCGKCIRGLVCEPCNSMLGKAKDDPERLRAGIAYLEKWERAKTPLLVQHWPAPTITAEMLN